MKKVVVLDDYEYVFTNSPIIKELKKEWDVEIYTQKAKSQTQLFEWLKEAEVIIPLRERTHFSADLLQKLTKLRLISQTGTGVAHIDLQAAKENNITIINMPGDSNEPVTELTFGLILACLRNISKHTQDLKAGEWIQAPGLNLFNKRLGIIGFGEIGKSVAQVARAFKAEVVAWSPSLTPAKAAEHQIAYLALEDLLKTADIISVHLRAAKELKGLLNRDYLKMIKKGAVFINTSRSALVDTETLIELLETNHLHSAGLDVYDIEPLPADHALTRLENVVLTPHIGWITYELLNRFVELAVKNMLNFYSGKITKVL